MSDQEDSGVVALAARRCEASGDAGVEDARFRFLSSLSDDLRTPLVTILGHANVLLDDESEPERRRSLESIRRSGEQLLLLLDDLLALRRLQAGPLDAVSVESDLRLVVETAVDQARSKAGPAKRDVTVDTHPCVPERARFDALRVRQAVGHLVENALRFGGDAPVRVRIGWRQPRTMRVEIEDSGPGLSAQEFARLSAPLVQGETTLARDFRGLGVGLPLVRGIATSLGGSLTCEGQEGVGTRMRLEFPAEPVRRGPLPNGTPAPFSGVRVLVAEDSPDIARLVRRVLEGEGIEVELVADGQAAVECALETQPDLVFMDLQMPVLDGFEAARSLRRAGFEQPIVALTANTAPNCRGLSIAAGCNAFVPKPIDRQILLETLRRHLPKPC